MKNTPQAQAQAQAYAQAYALVIYNKAMKAGQVAMAECMPIPMVVEQHANIFNDSSPVTEQWHVSEGICGFAWVNIKAKSGPSRRFINELKLLNIVSSNINDSRDTVTIKKDSYYGGFTFWVYDGGHSYDRKRAFAYAFTKVLKEYDIVAHVGSRLD